MVGAPRILQAVGKDGIYPGVFWFAKGFNANNDPWRGYILVFVVAMGFVMVAKLNAIGVIASNFFLAAYALMNLSCFHSDYTNAPNWRPSFKVGKFSLIIQLNKTNTSSSCLVLQQVGGPDLRHPLCCPHVPDGLEVRGRHHWLPAPSWPLHILQVCIRIPKTRI